MENEPKDQIIYKRDMNRCSIVLRPDTQWWRFRYWLNQYTALFLALLIRPIVRWNHAIFRLKEGEEVSDMFIVQRLGMKVQTPDPYMAFLVFPRWIRRNRAWLKTAFEHFK